MFADKTTCGTEASVKDAHEGWPHTNTTIEIERLCFLSLRYKSLLLKSNANVFVRLQKSDVLGDEGVLPKPKVCLNVCSASFPAPKLMGFTKTEVRASQSQVRVTLAMI